MYGIGLWSFIAATAMTLAAIIIPEWLVYKSDVPTPHAPHHTYGLHKRCTTTNYHKICHTFPTDHDCPMSAHRFCSLYRSTSFLFSLAFVLELVTFVAFAVVLLGGKQKRVRGWFVVCSLVACCVLCQLGGVGIMGWMGSHERRFEDGWVVGKSWVLAVVAVVIQIGVIAGVVGSRYYLEEEGGYELIPDRGV